jgi:hypothetical protein
MTPGAEATLSRGAWSASYDNMPVRREIDCGCGAYLSMSRF